MVYLYSHPQNALRIYDTTVAQNIADGVDKVLTAKDNLEKAIAIQTLPSKYHPSEYEGVAHLREQTWMEFVKWRMTTEENHAIEYVKTPESVGIMMPAGDVYNSSSRKLTKLPHAITELNMRDTGKYAQLEHNFRQHLTDFMKSSEGQQLAAFLDKSGYKAEDIEYIAIGFTREKAIYAVGRLPNGKVVIYAHKNSYKKIDDWAEKEGMKTEELREVAIAEEVAHIFRSLKPYLHGRIAEEKATKKTLLEFYENLAESTSNSELKAKYARIIRHLKHDIATVARYAKMNSNSLQDLVALYNSDEGELEQVLEAQAVYEGINTKEGIEEYVSGRLEEIAEAAEDCECEDSDGEAEACEAAEGDGGEAGGDGAE
jgi:hypothetical protein